MNVPGPVPPHLPPRPPTPAPQGHWAAGVAFSIGCIAMVIPLAIVASVIASAIGVKGEAQMVWLFMPMVLFGLSQWLFALPLGLYLRHRGKVDTAMGLWITAGVAMLLNGACFGLMAII